MSHPRLKHVLITGATSGIGRALTSELCRQGYRVFATGRDKERLAQLREQTGCLGESYDLSQSDEVLALYYQAEKALGQVDVLINNAGFNSRKAAIVDTSLEELEQQYAVNLRAPYLLCREALKPMMVRQRGYIINVVSTVAKRVNPTMGIYTATKQGLAGLNDVLMKEAQPHGVKVTALYPGGVDTAFRSEPRPNYMSAQSVAQTIAGLLTLPDDMVMHEMTFRPPVELE